MSDNMRICTSEISGQIDAIPSKSYAHRIAICNFLSGNDIISCCEGFTSNDIKVTEDCLNKLRNGQRVLDCGESGSTLRFLLPLVASLGGEYELIGHGKLMDRPNQELFSVLNAHGVKTFKDNTIKISGKLTPGEFRLRGDISSQYVSGLLMALPCLEKDSKIILTTPLSSASYVDITLEVLASYGVKIVKQDYGYFIKGNSSFSGQIKPEGDWSNSAFFLALGALCGQTTVNGLNLDSVQGDKEILNILQLAGATLIKTESAVKVIKSKLKAFEFDGDNCPDLVPIACVLASCAKGKSVIRNIQRLRLKESDRIQTTISMLNAFGIRAECVDNNLIVYGGKVKAGSTDCFNDHRIVMSATVLASVVSNGESLLTGVGAVNKSYPTFFEHFKKVGGNAYEL